MKQALQAILIAPNQIDRLNIMLGLKSITIREGHRDYREGPVILCCDIDPWTVKANIYEVQHKTLSQVSEEEWKADGYPDQEAMLADLQRWYPDLSMESPVTVIKWNNLEGFYTEQENIKIFSMLHGITDHLNKVSL